jgi:hypothetical protein
MMPLTLVTGALAGVFHVLSGPDHLAAVAPLAVVRERRGWLAGWTWGLGHASGVVVVAVLAILLRDSLPIQTISGWSERLVGGALIALGLWGLRRSTQLHSGAHAHSGLVHDHVHVQRGPRLIKRLGHAHASFCLGVLHGIAGSSHFLGVLPALALPSRSDALSYIIAFGVGTVAAMSAFAAVMGYAGARAPGVQGAPRALFMSTAVAAIVVGSVWLIRY